MLQISGANRACSSVLIAQWDGDYWAKRDKCSGSFWLFNESTTGIQSLLAFSGPSIDTMARPRYYLAANYSRDSWLWKRTLSSSSRPRKRAWFPYVLILPLLKQSFLNCCPRGYLNQFARLPKYNWIIFFFSHKYSSGLFVFLTRRLSIYLETSESAGIKLADAVFVQQIALALKCALIVKRFLKCKLPALHCDCSIYIKNMIHLQTHTIFSVLVNKSTCWWIIPFLSSITIILPVWIQGEEMLIGGRHLSTEEEGALSTLFTENVRLSRVILKLCCHIFFSSVIHFITMLPLKPWWNFLDVP